MKIPFPGSRSWLKYTWKEIILHYSLNAICSKLNWRQLRTTTSFTEEPKIENLENFTDISMSSYWVLQNLGGWQNFEFSFKSIICLKHLLLKQVRSRLEHFYGSFVRGILYVEWFCLVIVFTSMVASKNSAHNRMHKGEQ